MIPTNIVLYSLRAQGFVTPNGTYSSQIKDARLFTEAEAVAYAKRAAPLEGPSPLIPVERDVYTQINGAQQ